MTTLLISAAVNIGIGLLINAIFPPPDINQEGPRLTELGYTSAAYGRMVNIVFGTDRIAGNIIDTTDPAIEEVVSEESSGGGFFGTPTVNTTTYAYFLTGRISWCIEGATDIIRWWGDGKIILDATGTGQTIKKGVTHTFYPGGQDQIQDPEEVARRGSDIPAYGHLTSSKVDRMPLADYGNRIPNFTAEIAFNSSRNIPVLSMVEPAGFNPGDSSRWDYDPDQNLLMASKRGNTDAFTADATSMEFRNEFLISDIVQTRHTMGRDGFAYLAEGNNNRNPIVKIDLDTGIEEARFGDSSNDPLNDNSNGYTNAGTWYQLNSTTVHGVKSLLVHLSILPAGGPPNGSVTDADLMGNSIGFEVVRHIISTADGLTVSGDDLGDSGTFVALDHDRGIFYIMQDDDNAGTYNLVKYQPNYGVDTFGVTLQNVTASLLRTFSRGTFAGGDDFEGTGGPAGWAVNRRTGELILSNGTSMILYNPDTDTILAQKTNGSFSAEHNYYSGTTFGYAISNASNGTLRIIDTRTLEIIEDIKTDDIPWPSGTDGIINGESSTWDDRAQAIYLGRVGSDAADDFRILKVFVNRTNPLGVPLSDVVSALSTSYQRQKMAGLLPADIDVTTLTGDTVQGYNLNNPSSMKAALQPLRDRFLFDAHQSDWIIKFPKRGATPTVTIPEEDVGELKRGRTQTDAPSLIEVRQDDLSLPMSLGVRYRNKDTDYQIDVEHDKRHLFPNPTMHSKSERVLDIPIVDTSTPMKQLVQKTLLTLWNERTSYKTIVPWTYIALDATDVFNMGVFGETAQIRMAENDLGQGWSIEITGVVEDTKSFSSTLAGGTAAGHVGTTVPSGLPTRLFPLDAPLLSLDDLTTTPISNAYMAVGAFEDSWPGCTVLKSLDNVDFSITGTVNQECAFAKVRTAPGAWVEENGDFPNRWQETEDGGTMVITPLRRSDAWASTTESLLLAGANYVACIHESDDQVEIFAFQNAVLNDDNTITLTRLLRGRFGTEDIATLGITGNDTCILLSDSANNQETGPILPQGLLLSDLDSTLLFKGVTIGTLLEDASAVSHIYTGRDLRPFSPVHVEGAPDGSGGLDVSWERRARGPFAAEWLDGTGTVVLNETIEQYEVTLSVPTNQNFLTKIVDDATTVNITEQELIDGGAIPGGVARQEWPDDGDFAGPMFSNGWVDVSGGGNWFTTSSRAGLTAPAASVNSTFVTQSNDNRDAFIRSDVDLVTDLGMLEVDIPSGIARMSAWCGAGNADSGAFDDLLTVYLEVLNAGGSVLASTNTGQFVPSASWTQVGSIDATSRPLELPLNQAGARQLRCRLRYNSTGFFTDDSGYDFIEIEVTTLPDDLTIDVVQVSETGKKSPIGTKTI